MTRILCRPAASSCPERFVDEQVLLVSLQQNSFEDKQKRSVFKTLYKIINIYTLQEIILLVSAFKNKSLIQTSNP